MGNALCLILGQLRQPVAIALDDAVVGKPALVDPGVRANQEAIGMALEKLAPCLRELAVRLGDAAAVREFAQQRRMLIKQLAHARKRRREAGMRPNDLSLSIARKQNRERHLVAMGQNIKVAGGGKFDRLLDQRPGGGRAIDVELADAAKVTQLIFALDQPVDAGIGGPVRNVGSRSVWA